MREEADGGTDEGTGWCRALEGEGPEGGTAILVEERERRKTRREKEKEEEEEKNLTTNFYCQIVIQLQRDYK